MAKQSLLETLEAIVKASGATLSQDRPTPPTTCCPDNEAGLTGDKATLRERFSTLKFPPGRPPTADEVAEALGVKGDPNVKIRVHTIPAGVGPQPDETWNIPPTAQEAAAEIVGALNGRTPEDTAKLMGISFEVFQEVLRAQRKHEPMHSPHEAYGIIAEEFNKEFLDAIHADDHDQARKEAIQIAAMAIRFIFDVVD